MTNEEIDHCAVDDAPAYSTRKDCDLIQRRGYSSRSPIATITAALPTEIADEEGLPAKTNSERPLLRSTIQDPTKTVRFMKMEFLWSKQVPLACQHNAKVPLNVDRDNVPPSYMATYPFHRGRGHQRSPDRGRRQFNLGEGRHSTAR